MTDTATLSEWVPEFQTWAKESRGLFAQGKAKEAFAKYPWFQTKGDPFARLDKPASQSRFGLVTTGGYSVEGEHEPFSGLPDFSDTAPDFHVIGLDADPSKLRIDHHGYDHRFAKEDHNANLPFDRLKEMVADGELGSVSNDSIVLMGLAPNVAPLIEETVPRIVEKFRSDSVEGALLVPS
jgi:D-proline reductase (dithiol) PrdB